MAADAKLLINNRRYIGGKKNLLTQIQEVVVEHYGQNKCVIADLFAGTGVVAEHFFRHGYPVIVNDLLYSNFIAYEAWMSSEDVDEAKVESLVNGYSDIRADELKDNYFSKIYGEKYFSTNDARKIGYIRELIEAERGSLTQREYYIMLTSLMYAADKIANTVGHFEHYLSKKPMDRGVKLRMLNVDTSNKSGADIYNRDANELSKDIGADVVYIDPPYNARQYVNFYHVLENLARWEKPTEFEGSSMKFKRDSLKSGYSKSSAPRLMKELVSSINAKLVIVSYNNTYKARSVASNNKISEEELYDIMCSKGKVRIMEMDYKSFNAGKTDFKNHKEKLYVCEVNE
jgi:adenine-specific DNA-methyltransferase